MPVNYWKSDHASASGRPYTVFDHLGSADFIFHDSLGKSSSIERRGNHGNFDHFILDIGVLVYYDTKIVC